MSNADSAPASLAPTTVRVHLTNVTGMGAVQLASSLLPALESCPGYALETLYLPAAGALADYRPLDPKSQIVQRRRRLPNSVSRLLECTVAARRFDGASPLLVLGDIPLRCRCRQTVFVQTSLLTVPSSNEQRLGSFRHRVARQVFRLNQPWAAAFVVQSAAMRAALTATFPEVAGRVRVIGQPVPDWLRPYRGCRERRLSSADARLQLFYPGANYPYKNHSLLRRLAPEEAATWPVSSMTFTVPPDANPNPRIAWIECTGLLHSDQVIRRYLSADALVFLSLTESFGFPLVEAMWVGLPVVCPNLAYARALCGDGAIYFEPNDVHSLEGALNSLHQRLQSGWWPDWSRQLSVLPGSWNAVAKMLLDMAVGRTNFEGLVVT